MAMPHVRSRRHALCKKAKGAPLLRWVQFRRISNSNCNSKCGVRVFILLWYLLFGFPTSAPARVFYCWWMRVWFWWMWWNGYYVFWLYSMMVRAFRLRRRVSSAPLRSGPAKKPAGLPFSPPNARGPVPLLALYPRSTWGDLRCHSAGHSQQVVTGLKSTFLKAPRKSVSAGEKGSQFVQLKWYQLKIQANFWRKYALLPQREIGKNILG